MPPARWVALKLGRLRLRVLHPRLRLQCPVVSLLSNPVTTRANIAHKFRSGFAGRPPPVWPQIFGKATTALAESAPVRASAGALSVRRESDQRYRTRRQTRLA